MPSNLEERRPRGFVPIGIFFIFGATMAAYAGITLFFPGTFLDALWALNRQGQIGLTALGRVGALPFVILSPLLSLAAVGWFQRRRWGWALGLTIVAINMAGNLGEIVVGERLKGVVGVVIAGLLLVYMTRAKVRKYFAGSNASPKPAQ